MQDDPRFITVEGGEGAGKSTQIRLLAEWLQSQGIPVITTREPGGSEGAEVIRNLLVTGETDRWVPMSEALLMTAARSEHVERTIKPALNEGKWVLCDRFFDSSVAYQGAGRGLGTKEIRELQTLALGAFEPDLTLVLDLPVKTGLGRAIKREESSMAAEDRFERMDISFHETIRNAFLDIARADAKRCRVINADQSIENLHEEIISSVQKAF